MATRQRGLALGAPFSPPRDWVGRAPAGFWPPPEAAFAIQPPRWGASSPPRRPGLTARAKKEQPTANGVLESAGQRPRSVRSRGTPGLARPSRAGETGGPRGSDPYRASLSELSAGTDLAVSRAGGRGAAPEMRLHREPRGRVPWQQRSGVGAGHSHVVSGRPPGLPLVYSFSSPPPPALQAPTTPSMRVSSLAVLPASPIPHL